MILSYLNLFVKPQYIVMGFPSLKRAVALAKARVGHYGTKGIMVLWRSLRALASARGNAKVNACVALQPHW